MSPSVRKLIKFYLISYHLDDGRKVWWPECLDEQLADMTVGALTRQGMRPQLHLIEAKPAAILSLQEREVAA